MMYEAFAPIPDRSGLPLPQARVQTLGHESTFEVILREPALAWESRLVIDVMPHVLGEVILVNGSVKLVESGSARVQSRWRRARSQEKETRWGIRRVFNSSRGS